MDPRAAVEVLFTMRTVNASNRPRSNSRLAAVIQAREERGRLERTRLEVTGAMARARLKPADLIPAVVTITRFSAGSLDAHDGLRSALKRVVDGVAACLGIDDGRGPVRWLYEQVRAPRGVHGIKIRIERA